MHHSSAVRAQGTGGHLRARIGLSALFALLLATPPARAQSRVDNPFEGATWYLNPDYTAMVNDSVAKETDPTLKAQMANVATYPTAVWLDRIAAIQGADGRKSLAGHLDAALTQQQGEKPVVVIIVIYNLPGRDCSALASNGELKPDEIGRYKTEYIDPIAKIESDPKYAGLRIVNIIEIDSLPNLVTNLSLTACSVMNTNENYVKGIQYALGAFHKIPNVYNYIDAAHHAWIGWSSNLKPSATLFGTTAKGATGGVDTVQGFITNTSNYSALEEKYFTASQAKTSTWVSSNDYVDEKSFAIAFRQELVNNQGFSSKIGMLIDTSRNGWGGPGRPTKASTATDPNTMVNESRIDRRIHAGNWCNQVGAGLGERPQAVGTDGIHAYVWVKPPGESDGASKEIMNSEGKGFDQMCSPEYGGNARNGNSKTGAMPDAPLAGKWFHAQFKSLIQNAYPAVPASGGSSSGGSSSGGSSSGGSSSGASSSGASSSGASSSGASSSGASSSGGSSSGGSSSGGSSSGGSSSGASSSGASSSGAQQQRWQQQQQRWQQQRWLIRGSRRWYW